MVTIKDNNILHINAVDESNADFIEYFYTNLKFTT